MHVDTCANLIQRPGVSRPGTSAPRRAGDRRTIGYAPPLSPVDHERLFAGAADPLIWEQHPDKSRSEPAGFSRFFQEALDSGGALVAVDTASGQVIGSSRFHGYDQAADEVEIGWTFLARSHWGGQYNREMKRLMLEHAFRYVSPVVFLIDPANYRSRRAVEKIDAVRAGERSDSSGRISLAFQITAKEWRSILPSHW